MNAITLQNPALERLLRTDLLKLDVYRLYELNDTLDQEINALRKAKSQVDTALVRRYSDRMLQTLHESGRDFGTTHFTEGDVAIKADLPKRVKWDQAMLSEIAQRIAAAGEKVEDYIDVKFSVSESRYNAWPETLREQFAAARTVEAGKPSFSLTPEKDTRSVGTLSDGKDWKASTDLPLEVTP